MLMWPEIGRKEEIMSEFTKGEWAVGFSDQGLGHGTYGVMIKNTSKVVITDLTKDEAEDVCRRWNSQPDLLEACKEAQKIFGFIAENYKSAPHFPNVERLVDAAIAKATHKP